MKFLRNPEIQKSLLWHLLLAVLSGYIGFLHSLITGLYLLIFGTLYTLSHYLITRKRYQRLQQLSLELDTMLHNNTPVQFEKYREGELSILESELSKMTLRLSEQALALANDKKLLADSMADISHQIRSPLTASNLILSLLREPQLPLPRRQQLLQELSQLLSRIDWLVEALLKISKMDAGAIQMQHIHISVAKVIEAAAEPLLIPMELREQTLTIHKEDTSQAKFICDPAWTTEAVLNILKNCMEHTPAGGTIHVTFYENTIYTQIIIEDNGPGFAKEDLPHLFERFYKGKNASEHSVGIGLALSRMIVSQQNGTLKAENRSHGGARFIIKFYKK